MNLAGMQEQIDAIHASMDESFETRLLSRVPGALINDGDQIYIRKIDGRLQWIKANVHGGGQEWQELTPRLARQIEVEAILVEQKKINAEVRNGWYQDFKGNLYERVESGWAGKGPGCSVDELEYLG